jgi:hypothetical protein
MICGPHRYKKERIRTRIWQGLEVRMHRSMEVEKFVRQNACICNDYGASRNVCNFKANNVVEGANFLGSSSRGGASRVVKKADGYWNRFIGQIQLSKSKQNKQQSPSTIRTRFQRLLRQSQVFWSLYIELQRSARIHAQFCQHCSCKQLDNLWQYCKRFGNPQYRRQRFRRLCFHCYSASNTRKCFYCQNLATLII